MNKMQTKHLFLLSSILLSFVWITIALASTQADIARFQINPVLPPYNEVKLAEITPDSNYIVYEVGSNGAQHLYSTPLTGGDNRILTGSIVQGGIINAYEIAPNGRYVVYRSDRDLLYTSELYSAAVTGTVSVKLNGDLVSGGEVHDFHVSSDGGRVIYQADQEIKGKSELYSVPIMGGSIIKLNGILADNGAVVSSRISPDSARVVYRTYDNNIKTLYSTLITGSIPTILNTSGGTFHDYKINPLSDFVVYLLSDPDDAQWELFSVPITGGSSIKLNKTLLLDGNVRSFQISPDGNWVVYWADQVIDEDFELYSVPITGGVPLQLTDTFSGMQGVLPDFKIGSDSDRVVYATGDANLYSVPIMGGTTAHLNDTLPLSLCYVSWFYVYPCIEISANSGYVVFPVLQDSPDILNDLYSIPIVGGSVTKLVGNLEPNHYGFWISPDSQMVIYNDGSSWNDGTKEILYNVPITGGESTQLSHSLTDGNSVTMHQVSPLSNCILYSAPETRWIGLSQLYTSCYGLTAVHDQYIVKQNETLSENAPGVLVNDVNTEGATAVLLAPPTYGNLTLNPDGSFNYIPDADYWGSDSFTYFVHEEGQDSNAVTVAIAVVKDVRYFPVVSQ